MSENNEKQNNDSNFVKILDHGFVRLVDVMPASEGEGDFAIVQAARVSYGKGTKKVSQDRALIRYLLRNEHTSPFEMVEFKFHIKIPIFVARQLIRHRTANVNEYSGRYSVMLNEFYLPERTSLRTQSKINKQGRDKELPFEKAEEIRNLMQNCYEYSYNIYKKLLNEDNPDEGVARELARIVLPTAEYTEMYWKIDLHNLMRFLRLRYDEHAQEEIREFSKAVLKIIRKYVPITIEAWEDYVLNSIKLSKREAEILLSFITNKKDLFDKIEKDEYLSKTEKFEMKKKLENFFLIKKL